ncbi:MAG: tetratricopeptide repeat protein [Pyrinomonadaceae bacterium]
MNKSGITFGIVGIIIGLTVGFFGANYLNRNSEGQISGSPAPLNSPGNMASPRNTAPGAQFADVQKVIDLAKTEPDNYEAQIEAGEMFSKIERFEEALPYYETAHKLKPEDLKANIILGNGYFDAKQYEKAGTYYAKALEIDPNNVSVRTDYGLTFFLREPNDTDRAIVEFKKSLEIDPDHELTLQNLSAALNEKRDEKELAITLEKLKQVNPNNAAIKRLEADQ